MATITMEDILQLSVEDRIKLVEDIWDTVAANPVDVTLTAVQRIELEKRLKAHREDGGATALSWDEVEKRVRESR